jgi:hypothetical protein
MQSVFFELVQQVSKEVVQAPQPIAFKLYLSIAKEYEPEMSIGLYEKKDRVLLYLVFVLRELAESQEVVHEILNNKPAKNLTKKFRRVKQTKEMSSGNIEKPQQRISNLEEIQQPSEFTSIETKLLRILKNINEHGLHQYSCVVISQQARLLKIS